jgi:hypothetical protein
MIAHIYLSVLQAVSGRGSAGCLDSCFQVYEGEAMHYLGYELRRIPIPRISVNTALDLFLWLYQTFSRPGSQLG